MNYDDQETRLLVRLNKGEIITKSSAAALGITQPAREIERLRKKGYPITGSGQDHDGYRLAHVQIDLDPMPLFEGQQGYVYFVEPEGEQPPTVKIGWSSSEDEIRKGLRTAAYRTFCLRLRFPGTKADEKRLHDRWAAHRVDTVRPGAGTEWFFLVPAIRQFIKERAA